MVAAKNTALMKICKEWLVDRPLLGDLLKIKLSKYDLLLLQN